jgi:protein-disulfide isomerase
MRLLTSLAVGLTIGLAACSPAKMEDKAFGQKVRAYLLEHPELLQEMSDRLQQKQRSQEAAVAKAGIKKNRMALERDSRDIVFNPDGKITVVEFFDYQCSYCKLTAPEVVELVRQNPDVRVVLKDFIIFGPTSEYAAKAMLAAKDSGKSLALFQAMMAEKPLTEQAVDRILTEQGLNPAGLKAEMAKPQIAKHLADTHTLAQELGLVGTPAFVIGDTLVPGADMEAVKTAIAKARNG